jgi:hypothetical protein
MKRTVLIAPLMACGIAQAHAVHLLMETEVQRGATEAMAAVVLRRQSGDLRKLRQSQTLRGTHCVARTDSELALT